MWFIVVEVAQETSAPPPKKNPGSAPALSHQKGGCLPSLVIIAQQKNSEEAPKQKGAGRREG